ncbi:hypothetical protein GmHk_02G003893 [Glycine max]|nr:hypothetical protein GmHk_02G003893 [Glycine max]
MLKMGDSAKVVIKQDMKGRRHKYGFNNNEREKTQKKRVVDDETADKHQLDEVLRRSSSFSKRGTSNNLKVVHSGTKEFKIASHKRDLFLGFSEHQERLRKKFALEERRIFAANEQIMGSPPASTPPPPPPPPPPSPPSPPPPPTSDALASTRNLISQRLLTVERKESYYRPWGRDGGSLNQTSRGNGPLQSIRTVSRTLSVTNMASARKSGPSFARLAETLLGRMCA